MRQPRSWFWQLLLAVVVTSGAAAVAVRAQTLADVRPGERVQLTLRDSLRQQPVWPARQVVLGQFVRASVDSVWLRPTGASEFSVARPALKGARVSRGASRRWSALTFGLSAGFGFAAAVAIDQIDTGRDFRTRDVLIAGSVGLGAGALIGAISPYEHWRSVRH